MIPARHPYQDQLFEYEHVKSECSATESSSIDSDISDSVDGSPMSPAASSQVRAIEKSSLAHGDDGDKLAGANQTSCNDERTNQVSGCIEVLRSDWSFGDSSANVEEKADCSERSEEESLATIFVTPTVSPRAEDSTSKDPSPPIHWLQFDTLQERFPANELREADRKLGQPALPVSSTAELQEEREDDGVKLSEMCGNLETNETDQGSPAELFERTFPESSDNSADESCLEKTDEHTENSGIPFEEESEVTMFTTPASLPRPTEEVCEMLLTAPQDILPQKVPLLQSSVAPRHIELVPLGTERDQIATRNSPESVNTKTQRDAYRQPISHGSSSHKQSREIQANLEQEDFAAEFSNRSEDKNTETADQSEEFTRLTKGTDNVSEREVTEDDTGPTEYWQSFVEETERLVTETESVDSTLKCTLKSYDISESKRVETKSVGIQVCVERPTAQEYGDNTDQISSSSSSVGTQTKNVADQATSTDDLLSIHMYLKHKESKERQALLSANQGGADMRMAAVVRETQNVSLGTILKTYNPKPSSNDVVPMSYNTVKAPPKMYMPSLQQPPTQTPSFMYNNQFGFVPTGQVLPERPSPVCMGTCCYAAASRKDNLYPAALLPTTIAMTTQNASPVAAQSFTQLQQYIVESPHSNVHHINPAEPAPIADNSGKVGKEALVLQSNEYQGWHTID